MSDTVDLTLLAGTVQEIARAVRLMSLQADSLSSRTAGIDGRLASLEQSFHDLVGEVSRGFGQMQQQLTRQEKRLDVVDVGLTALRTDLAAHTDRIIAALRERS